jgi:hypothetical protein
MDPSERAEQGKQDRKGLKVVFGLFGLVVLAVILINKGHEVGTGKQPDVTATTAAAVIPTGPFKRVDAQYLVNMSKHGTDAHDVELTAVSCEVAPWKDSAVLCTDISDSGLFVRITGKSVSGSTEQLARCKEMGQSGCAFRVRFTFIGGGRNDALVKSADTTIGMVDVPTEHIIIEALN